MRTSVSQNSPLHTAIHAQLLGRISLDRAAPAIFLLAHEVFDPVTLRLAASIYASADILGAGILMQCLHEEAGLREVRADAGNRRAA